MSANGQSGGASDVQIAIQRHKEKKAKAKARSAKQGITIEENNREDDAENDDVSPAPEVSPVESGQVVEESGGLQRFMARLFGPKKLSKSLKNNRQSIRVATEAANASSGVINTQVNRGLLEKYLNHVFAVTVGILFIIGIIRQFIPSLGLGSDCVGCLVSLSSAIVQTIIVFIVLGIQLVASVFIFTSKVKDQFKIGRELQFLTVVWFLLLFPACILAIRGTSCEELRTELSSCSTFDTFTKFCYYNFAAQHILIVGCVIITFFITTCIPVFVTYSKGRKRLLNEPVKIPWPNFTALTSLKECLADDDAADALQQFCIQSFCVEQILFWKDAESYRTVAVSDFHERQIRAVALYKRYIDASGALFVQLPEDIQADLDNRLAEAAQLEDEETDFDYNFEVDNTVFLKAQYEVFRQMETETFPQFLRSEMAKKLYASFEAKIASATIARELDNDGKAKDPSKKV